MLAGRSGSGKSTIAYACGRGGFPQFADDKVVWRIDESAATALPLPFASRLRLASRDFFKVASARAPLADAPVAAATPIAAVVVLSQDAALPEPIRVQHVRPARAFSMLLPFAEAFDADDRAEAHRLASDHLDLVSRVPTLGVTYRPGVQSIAGVQDAVLTAVAGVVSCGSR
jgi:hypothetical protein